MFETIGQMKKYIYTKDLGWDNDYLLFDFFYEIIPPTPLCIAVF